MLKNKFVKRKPAGTMILSAIIYLLAFGISAALAQELPSVNVASIDVNGVAGTPIDSIISAVDGGGLSTSQNLVDLKPKVEQSAAQVPASPQPSPADPKAAGMNSSSLQDLESQGGLSTNPEVNANNETIFKLAITFFDRVIFRKDVEFANKPTFKDGLDISGAPTFDSDTAGYAIIKKGNQSVVVDFDQEYDTRPVVTASLSLEQYDNSEVRAAAEDLLLVSDVKYIVANVTKKSFEIIMDRKADSDIPFSWHALSVKNPKTFKKKGESPDSGMASPADAFSPSANSETIGKKNSAAAGPAAVNQSDSSSSGTAQANSDGSQNQAASSNSASNLSP